MKLAIDGGAFQQGIAAGILNVGVGLMNAVIQLRPEIKFVLVVDPRLGPVREDLLSRLNAVPEIVCGEVGPAYANYSTCLTTDMPNIRFEVDGIVTSANCVDGQVKYKGPPPNQSFHILSRADKPSTTRGRNDDRLLGVGIDRIAILTGKHITCIDLSHPGFAQGFHNLEGAMRWTNGRAKIPLEFFPPCDNNIEVTIDVKSTMSYRVSEGIFDDRYRDISKRITDLTLQIARIEVEEKLLRCGVSAYISNHFLPVHFDNLINYAILYDIIPLMYPEFFFADARENFAHNLNVFEKAEHVFSISETSRSDLVDALRISASRITAMMIDIDPVFTRMTDKQVKTVRNKYLRQTPSYIIMVATLEPRKNHARMIDAFAEIVKENNFECDLVLVGKPGWGTDNLIEKINQHHLERRIHLLNNVTNEELASLYSGALFSVYPSLYEGFGLPVLESMACGCAVITSNRSSMQEIAGEAALLVDPTSVASLVQSLYTMLTNEAVRKRYINYGLEKRKQFSWEATAQKFLDGIMEHH